MKRLQFRHHDELFDTREDALAFFSDILNSNHVNSNKFGTSLYAEPMVVKYKDNEGNTQILLAIGVEDGNKPYHIIDSADIIEKITSNQDKISALTETNIELDKKVNDIKSEIQNNKITVKLVQPTEENVFEEYAFIDGKGDPLGNNIKVYKDNTFIGAKVGYKGAISVVQKEDGSFEFAYEENSDKDVEYLYLIYRNEKGILDFAALDFENFLMEAEFGDGIKVDNHVASIKINENEKFLNVDENGLYTMNITENINESINKVEKDYIQRILDASTKLEKNKIISNDVTLEETEKGVNLTLKVDGKTIVKNEDGRLSSPLKVKRIDNTHFKLIDNNQEQLGDIIEIPKESSLHDVRQGQRGASVDPYTGSYTEGTSGIKTLDFTYRLDDGTYRLTQIEISDYFIDITYGNGLCYNDNIISLVRDEKSENYLEIYDDSIAITGVTNAINATVSSAVSIAKNDLVANIDKLNSKLTDNIDSLQKAIANEQTNRTEAIANEQKDRTDAIARVQSELQKAITTEQTNRTEAIANEQKDRTDAIARVQSQIQTESRTIAENTTIKILEEKLNAEDINKLLEALENFKESGEDITEVISNALLKTSIITGDTSLIKIDEEGNYSVSNDAKDLYIYENGNKTTNLNEKITKLEERIKALETKESVNETAVKEIINKHIKGKENEIQVQSGATEMIISFDDNAIFG